MIYRFFKVVMIVHLVAELKILQVVVPGFSPDTQDVPIDGCICLLMATGIGYGIKKTTSIQIILREIQLKYATQKATGPLQLLDWK
jgi:hypothetical protein